MTYLDIIQAGFPDASEEQAEHLLWSRTTFPMLVLPKEIYKAASTWFRALKNNRKLCEFCDCEVIDEHDACIRCRTSFNDQRK